MEKKTKPYDIEQLSKCVAAAIYPHNNDTRQREAVEYWLIAFANEIHRRSIEP